MAALKICLQLYRCHPQQEAALQELAEIAQEYNMGYGESENNRSKFENDTSVEGLWD